MNQRAGFLAVMLLAIPVGAGLALGACELASDIDRSKIDADSGVPATATGVGGAGGEGGSVSSAGGAGGANGGGGAGTGGRRCDCVVETDCPVPAEECLQASCDACACGTKPVDNGTPLGAASQTVGDCKTVICDGNGGKLAVADPADTQDDMKECTNDVCSGVIPEHPNAPTTKACSENGGAVCDGAGTCVECNVAADCGTGFCTAAHKCAPATCNDQVTDGDETDVDCGGACGATCGDGDACLTGADCITAMCNAGVCIGPSCTDGLLNQDETDVDCGGAICAPCAGGEACLVAADCATGFCADGVCCDSACGGACQACSAAEKGSGADGVCGPIADGTDPDDECTDQGAITCGTDGACNGAGACRLYPTGTVCGAQSCAAGVQTDEDDCDGAGTCVDGGTTNCTPYVCGGTSCKTSCVNSMDCLMTSGTYCNQAVMQCVPKKSDGQTCMGNNQCQSNVCTLGICRPAICGNMVEDPTETDIDCGGVCGATCGTGQGCTTVGDCAPPNTQCIGAPLACQP